MQSVIQVKNLYKLYYLGEETVRALDGVELAAPVALGQVVLENVCGTGANVVATREL